MIDPITMTVMSALLSPSPALVWQMPAIVDDDATKALATVEKLITDFDDAMEAFLKKYRAATTDEERQALFQKGFPQPTELMDELKAIVDQHPKTKAAERAVEWAYGQGRAPWALEKMLTDFADSPALEVVPMGFRTPSTDALETLQKIADRAGTRRAKALAQLQLGALHMQMSLFAKDIAEPGSSGDARNEIYLRSLDQQLKLRLSTADAAKACHNIGKQLLTRCMKQYGDVPLYDDPSVTVKDKAETTLFEFENLQVGCVAPDIEGVDADGVSFKLSDYRGQVVVLDFWGFW